MQVDVSKLQVYHYNLFLMFKHNLFLCLFNHLDLNHIKDKKILLNDLLYLVFCIFAVKKILYSLTKRE